MLILMGKVWLFIVILLGSIFISAKTTAAEQPEQYIIRFKANTSQSIRQQLFNKYKGIWKKDLPLVDSSVIKITPSLFNLFQKDPNIELIEKDIIFTALGNETPSINIKQVTALGICDWFPQLPSCAKLTPKPTPSVSPSPLVSPILNPSPSPTGPPVSSPTVSPTPSSSPISNQTIPWGISKISAPQAWEITKGTDIKVAVVDTGIDTSHPDLKTNIAGCLNFISPTKTCEDDNGHGTHVAGTIAALDNNLGVVGVAPNAKIYALKVLNKNGSGYLSDIIESLDWSINNQMQVINMSLGSSSGSTLLSEAVVRVYNAGIIMVAAAGNSGPSNNTVNYPAKYPQVIAVAGLDKNDSVPSWSSRGAEVFIAAPGKDIYSTYYMDTYKTLSGTSMATPHVVGAVALRLQITPNTPPLEMKNLIKNSADILPLSVNLVGAGRVNAYKLVTAE